MSLASSLTEKELAIFEKNSDLNSINIAVSYCNIGDIYSNQGDYSKALEYCFKAFSIQKKVLGVNHPDTALSYNNIGNVYSNQDDYPKALEFFLKAVSVQEKVLPRTALSYKYRLRIFRTRRLSSSIRILFQGFKHSKKVLGA